MAITWLADVLRAAGCAVVEHPGWRTHVRAGSWEPRYGVVHATAAPASQPDSTQVAIVRDGRSDLPGPIANACVDRLGRWHVLSAGRCNTTLAGTAGPYAGLGNTYALGVEACNDNRSEPWPDVQYEAYARGWAAICRRLGWAPDRLRGHKEHTPGRKTDPTFDMGQFRARVAYHLAGTATTTGDDDMEPGDVLTSTRSGPASVGHVLLSTYDATTLDVRPAVARLETEIAKVRGLLEQLVDRPSALGGGASAAEVRAVVDEELDEQARAGADAD